jgi:hypothetical protein
MRPTAVDESSDTILTVATEGVGNAQHNLDGERFSSPVRHS